MVTTIIDHLSYIAVDLVLCVAIKEAPPLYYAAIFGCGSSPLGSLQQALLALSLPLLLAQRQNVDWADL